LPDRRDILFRKNRNRDRNETSASRRAGGVRRVRAQREGNSGAEASRNAKSAGAAANPLISLKTAKEYLWKSLEKAWKSLEFPWKGLDFCWKGLEKFGPRPYPA
jgi:hypothetical protein